jgi:hypothetical protein
MKNGQILRRLSGFLVDQDGAIAVVIALLLPVLFGFAGLAVDIGHIYAVDSQLKNAADAGALSGAKALLPLLSGIPNWSNAETEAPKAVKLNYYDADTAETHFTDCEVTYGYWSFTANSNPPSLQSPGIIPTANDYPAVMVKVSKTAGKNGGPVQMFLASVLGVLSADRSATSVAIISFPTGMKKGGLKPMVATKDIVDKYWDWPLGTPVVFKLGDGKTAEDTMWTTFLVSEPADQANAATLSRTLIQEGNPDPIYSAPHDPPSSIYLQPGVEATLYGDATGDKITGMGDFKDQTVVIPVVDVDNLTVKTQADVQGFIAFHITDFSQGGRYIQGYFDKSYTIENPQTGSSNVPTNPYSIAISPQLVY